MARKWYKTEEIVSILRQFEVELGQGKSIEEISKEVGISANTYYKWKKNYGGLDLSEARRLKELELENTRLKKLVADLSIDNQILKEFKKKLECQ